MVGMTGRSAENALQAPKSVVSPVSGAVLAWAVAAVVGINDVYTSAPMRF